MRSISETEPSRFLSQPDVAARKRVKKRRSHKYDWRSALSQMEGAYSANTIRSYRADFEIFEAWCEAQGHAALPATPEVVANFVQAQSESAAPATVGRRRASIARIHRLLNLENPVRAEVVDLATRKIYRLKGLRQEQVLGLTAPLKQALIDACPDDPRGLRDRALIATGYDTLCRRSELVALRIEDISLRSDGSGTILVRKSKADQFGHGRLAYLSADTIVHISRWLEATELAEGPLLRRINGPFSVGENALNGYTIACVIKTRAREAKLSVDQVAKLSGHSMRVGAAQDMAAAGIDLGAIMHAGGWKSPEMVMRYIEHMDVQRSGMARMYGSR